MGKTISIIVIIVLLGTALTLFFTSQPKEEITYNTLDELKQALSSEEAIDVIKLGADIYVPNTSDSAIVITKSVTIDGNGHKIYCSFNSDNYTYVAPIIVMNDATLTINNLSVESSIYAINVGKKSLNSSGKLIINSGSFKGDTTCVQVQLGEATINGGYFEATPYENSYRFTLNCIDSTYASGNAKFVVKGGSFYNYNPAQSESESPTANFVAEGYQSNSGEGTNSVLYTVTQVTSSK